MFPQRNKLGLVCSMAFIIPMIRATKCLFESWAFILKMSGFPVLSTKRKTCALKQRPLTLNACLFLSQVFFIAHLRSCFTYDVWSCLRKMVHIAVN